MNEVYTNAWNANVALTRHIGVKVLCGLWVVVAVPVAVVSLIIACVRTIGSEQRLAERLPAVSTPNAIQTTDDEVLLSVPADDTPTYIAPNWDDLSQAIDDACDAVVDEWSVLADKLQSLGGRKPAKHWKIETLKRHIAKLEG